MCFTTGYRFKDPRKTTQLFARITSHLKAMAARRLPCPHPAAKARFTVEERRAVKGQVGVARVGHSGRGRRNHHKICCRTMHLQDVVQHQCVVSAGEQAVEAGGEQGARRPSKRSKDGSTLSDWACTTAFSPVFQLNAPSIFEARCC
jgi:hypothetical protein